MLTLRKIDFALQAGVGVLSIAAFPFLFFAGLMIGLFIIGCLQLISAALNSRTFLTNNMGREICTYWTYTGLIIASLALIVVLAEVFEIDDAYVFGLLSMICAVPVAVYYCKIYQKLISKLEFRSDLSKLIKSTH